MVGKHPVNGIDWTPRKIGSTHVANIIPDSAGNLPCEISVGAEQ